MTTIQQNILQIKNKIRHFENKYQRASDSVSLLAVSKGQTIAQIKAAISAKQFHFGESYVQEALPKITSLAEEYQCVWHFIGPLQRNKTKNIAAFFSWVHSVDSPLIAKRLNDQRPTTLAPLNICIEVNISKNTQKAGVLAQQLLPLITYCNTLPHLKLRGLMVIPDLCASFAEQKEIFLQTYLLQQQLIQQGFQLDTLSMGMSHDMEAAIAAGASIVRIGRAIFAPHTVTSTMPL